MKEENGIRYIEAYLRDADYYVKLLKRTKELKSLMSAWREKVILREGFIDKEKKVEYQFHGIGICFIDHKRNKVVDVDFGPNERVDGFDAWRLHQYIENNKEFENEHVELSEIEAFLGSLVKKKALTADKGFEDSGLYYFV